MFVALTALTIGGFGASAGAFIGWHGAGPLPNDAASLDLVRSLFPGAGVTISGRNDALFSYEDDPNVNLSILVFGSDDFTAGSVTLGVSGGGAGEALDRLTAAGWTTRRNNSDDVQASSFSAARRDVAIEVDTQVQDSFFSTRKIVTTVYLERAQPAAVRWLALAGWALGIGLGLLLAWFVRRRSYAGTVTLRVAVGVLLFLTGDATQWLGSVLFDSSGIPQPPPFEDYMWIGLGRLTALAGVVCLLAAVVLAQIAKLRGRTFASPRGSVFADNPLNFDDATGGEPWEPATG
jgi:hypothetical protein